MEISPGIDQQLVIDQRAYRRVRLLLAAMGLFQVVWLLGIWITGASSNIQKLSILAIYSLIACIVLILFPERFFINARGWIIRSFGTEKKFLTILAVVLLIIGAYYAANQRIWTWDEEENYKVSQVIAHGDFQQFFSEYSDNKYLGTRHPPLVPLVNGFVMSIFGTSLFVQRMVSLLFCYGIIIILYLLGSFLYNRITGSLAIILYLTFPLVIRLSTAGLLDIQVTFFFCLAIWLMLKLMHSADYWSALGLGAAIGFGLITKYNMVFILPLLLVILLYSRQWKRLILPLMSGIVVTAIIWGSWMLVANRYNIGIPGARVTRIFSQDSHGSITEGEQEKGNSDSATINVSIGWFVFSASGRQFLLNSLATRLPSALGPYHIPVIILGIWWALKHRSRSDLLVLAWIGITTILLLFTLPDHRYFMVIFPAIALSMAVWLHNHPRFQLPVLGLSLLYLAGVLYLFIDWYREALIRIQ